MAQDHATDERRVRIMEGVVTFFGLLHTNRNDEGNHFSIVQSFWV